MKKLLSIFAVIFLSLSCFAAGNVVIPNVNGGCNPNSEIGVHFSGDIVKKPAKLPESIKRAVVINTSTKYFYDGEYRTSAYEVIYYDVTLNSKEKSVKKGDKILISSDDHFNITIRSKILDPYLVGCSNTIPVKVEGYFYYLPGMLLSNIMKYFDYDPIDDEALMKMYKHVIEPDPDDPDWAPGVALFEWHSLLNANLSEYPELTEPYSVKGVPIESTCVTDYNDVKLRLHFQHGFKKYLEQEYKLNEPLYLYLVIYDIDFFSKEVNCYVRDFSLESPTEIVKSRFKIIEEQLK